MIQKTITLHVEIVRNYKLFFQSSRISGFFCLSCKVSGFLTTLYTVLKLYFSSIFEAALN